MPSTLETKFALYWKAVNGMNLTCEHQFAKPRRWRFDFAHIESKTAIEIEGGTWMKGAHTRGKHYRSDCEKYNTATRDGWAVLRLTGEMISVVECEQIKNFILRRMDAGRGHTMEQFNAAVKG